MIKSYVKHSKWVFCTFSSSSWFPIRWNLVMIESRYWEDIFSFTMRKTLDILTVLEANLALLEPFWHLKPSSVICKSSALRNRKCNPIIVSNFSESTQSWLALVITWLLSWILLESLVFSRYFSWENMIQAVAASRILVCQRKIQHNLFYFIWLQDVLIKQRHKYVIKQLLCQNFIKLNTDLI